MKPVTEYYRTEAYLLPSVKPGHTCMAFWMLVKNTDGTFDILRKDFYPICNLRYPVATGLNSHDAVRKIRELQKDAEERGRKVRDKSPCRARLERDDYFAESLPLMQYQPYAALLRLERLQQKKKPNFKL